MSDLSALQYPIGKFTRPQTLSPEDRAAAIETIAGFPARLAAALEGASDARLDTPYRPGGWTVRVLVHHIADSHMNAYCRFRLALTENWPVIFAYEEKLWAALPDSQLPVAVSLRLLDSLHQRWAATLRSVVGPDWSSRGYMHPENGSQTLEQVLALYAWHSRHHLAHVANGLKGS